MTPIAASLGEASKDFAGKEGQNNIIILLSDGEEDCNGDHCAAAKTVHDAGIHLQVNVIGLHVLPKERTQLECVARRWRREILRRQKRWRTEGRRIRSQGAHCRSTAATPAPAPTPTNILGAANGGQMISAPEEIWQQTIDGKEDEVKWFSVGRRSLRFQG